MRKYLLLLSVLMMWAEAYAQDSIQNKGVVNVVKHVIAFNKLYPHEKVYLHFDNTGYFKGETIWYKAYVVRNDDISSSDAAAGGTEGRVRNKLRPTDISKVLYVELVSPGGDILETQKLHIGDDGGCEGQFALDSIIGSGFYEVRAYTRYMTNWGAEAMFSRVFPVFEKPEQYGDYSHPVISKTLYKDRNPNVRMADSLYFSAAADGVYTNDEPKKINARFFPEGGDMIAGIRCRVAMLVVDDNGAAYSGRGEVVNEKGDKICDVVTDSTGRALVSLIPSADQLYLSMQNPKGKIQKIAFPEAKIEGCSMMFDAVSDDMNVEIRCSGGVCGQELGYALMHEGQLFSCDTMLAEPLIELELLRSTMPEGVNQFTVFDARGRIMAERLFFICPKGEAADSITFTTETSNIGPCSEVEITAHTVPNTTFSFSALDYGAMTGGRQGNASTWMLLSSDVKGYIADIDWYFEADDAEHRRGADLLMMVQGWRRYDWNLMAGNKWFETVQPIEDRLYLYGKLREYRKKNPVANVAVDTYLYNKHGQSLSGSTTTDANGSYILNLPDVSGEWQLQIFTKINDKRKTFYVGIDRQFAPVPRYLTPDETVSLPLPRLPLQDNDAAIITGAGGVWQMEDSDQRDMTKKAHLLPAVTVKGRRYWTDSDDIMWYDQKTGRHWASIYYNAQEELDRILDRGEAMPTVFQFLAARNPMFNNRTKEEQPMLMSESTEYETQDAETSGVGTEAEVGTTTEDWRGWMTYGGRNIRWIVDNGLATYVSTTGSFTRLTGQNSFDDIITFPEYLNEVKAIYISPWSPKEEESNVVIHVYRQQRFTTESQKGLRRTFFQGYNEPEVFRMEDLSVLPPLENMRRTLFWAPDVTTDSEGNAKIKFINNLSARKIYLSAEGLTPDGRMVVNE